MAQSKYTQESLVIASQRVVARGSSDISIPVSVATKLAGILYLFKAKLAATADLIAGLDSLSVQVSPDISGNNWITYGSPIIPTATAAVTPTLTGVVAVGGSTFLANPTGAMPTGPVFISDATVGNATGGEWHFVKSVAADTNIVTVDGLAYAKAVGDKIITQAEIWAIAMDLSGISRIRLVTLHQGATGSDWCIKALLCDAVSIGS